MKETTSKEEEKEEEKRSRNIYIGGISNYWRFEGKFVCMYLLYVCTIHTNNTKNNFIFVIAKIKYTYIIYITKTFYVLI